MYFEFSTEIGEHVLSYIAESRIDEVAMIFDQTVTGGQRELLRKSLSSLFESRERHLTVLFHPLSTDFNGQIADYVSWAKFRQLERDDSESWRLITTFLNPTTQALFDE